MTEEMKQVIFDYLKENLKVYGRIPSQGDGWSYDNDVEMEVVLTNPKTGEKETIFYT